MTLINSISLITAFFGGMVALFAPCCITFLLPSYLANIFRTKTNVVLMTLVFGLGIATVLVPVALGIRAVGQFFQNYHTQTYVAGGIFMILLGAIVLSGKKVTIPMLNLTVDVTKNRNPWTVYVLGVFSGFTTSCCTPVLAGVLTLSFLSPTFFWAGLAGFSYVAGMVVPLVVLAIFLDKIHWEKLPLIRNKTVAIGGKKIPVTDIVAGILYIAVGVVFSALALTGNITMGETHGLEESLGTGLMNIVRFLRTIPFIEYIFAVGLITGIVLIMKKRRQL